MNKQAQDFKQLIDEAKQIVVLQADNPDGDSLGSSLALEAYLTALNKEVSLFCTVDMPDYLKYLTGWSRIEHNLPKAFDLAIIVDASTTTLFEKAGASLFKALANKHVIVLDHHGTTNNDIDAALIINESQSSSTAELVYNLFASFDIEIPDEAFDPLMTGILSDTQGLSNQLAQASTYKVMADLLEKGADRAHLEDLRREYNKMAPEIYTYKAALIQRTEFVTDNKIAYVIVPNSEITTYSPLYNPGPLVQADMLQVKGVQMAVVFKVYDDGHLTATIRCNNTAPVADKLAKAFSGGGHALAAGFKVTNITNSQDVIAQALAKATELLDTLDKP